MVAFRITASDDTNVLYGGGEYNNDIVLFFLD